jgi:O-phosphoseryl-tRNA(Cys) synthetase
MELFRSGEPHPLYDEIMSLKDAKMRNVAVKAVNGVILVSFIDDKWIITLNDRFQFESSNINEILEHVDKLHRDDTSVTIR